MAYKIPASSGGGSTQTQFVVRNVNVMTSGAISLSSVPSGKFFVPTFFAIYTTTRTGVSPGAATVSVGTVGTAYNNLVSSVSYNQPSGGFYSVPINTQLSTALTNSVAAYFNVSAASTGGLSYLVDIFLTGFYTG